MTDFVTFEANGAIKNVCQASLPAAWVVEHWARPPGGGLVVLPMPLTGPMGDYRVLDGQVVERLAMAVEISAASFVADGVAECVLSGLPDPCTVTLTGAVSAGPLDVVGGSLTLTSTTPGVIQIRITADPVWKPWEGAIHAT